MTHLHLRTASSLQTASRTVDDPNFERRSGSDVSQMCASVADPLVSPQPVVGGIHFEDRTVEGPIINPPGVNLFLVFFLFKFLQRAVYPTGTRSRRHARTHTQTRAPRQPNLAKFTRLRFQVREGSTGRQRSQPAAVWVITGKTMSNLAAPRSVNAAVTRTGINITRQVLRRARRLCAALLRKAQVSVRHDKHTD